MWTTPGPTPPAFSSLQSNFIREEIRLHLTSNDAVWEAEEKGSRTLPFLFDSFSMKEKGRGKMASYLLQ